MTPTTRLAHIERSLLSVGLVVLGSVVIALGLFLATSTHPAYKFLGGAGWTYHQMPGFDPLTGEPQSVIYTIPSYGKPPGVAAVRTTVVGDLPIELVGRRAISLPMGFAIGLAVTVGALALVRRRGTSKPQLSVRT